MPDTITVEVICHKCGRSIGQNIMTVHTLANKVDHIHVIVDPCSQCLDAAGKEGYEVGCKVGEIQE